MWWQAELDFSYVLKVLNLPTFGNGACTLSPSLLCALGIGGW